MKMKIHDITGYEAGWTWRSVLRGIAVCSAALCLTAACSREEAVSDPVAVGMYDGPLTIRADIGGMLETRATHPDGNLQDEETWVLSSEGDHYQEFFKADFSKGYGEFEDKNGPVEINWSSFTPTNWDDYIIGLDNGPIGWKSDGGLNICYIAEKGTSFVNLAAEGDGDEMIEKYKAQVEPEDGTMARNDFISGRYQENSSTALNKNWITIQLRHRMSRVHVEITAPIIQDLGEREDVQVWMTPLAEKCYGIERVYGDERIIGQNHPGVSIDKLKWVEEQKEWILDPDESGEKVFRSKLYLLGSDENGEALTPVDGEEETFLTHYLIMPPQTTHLQGGRDDLRPKLYVKIGEKTFSGVIPGNITVVEGNEPKLFTEFGGGQNITLKVRIDDEPPVIDIQATVRQWEDMGTWLMGTDRGGIRNEQDFKSAVEAFKEYVNRNPQPQWTSGTEKPEPLERYGNFDFTGEKFTFQFFDDFAEEEKIPDECKIASAYEHNFDVSLNGHTVYGVTGVDEKGNHDAEFKQKMLSN